jgi:hypothetical protein
MSESTKFAGSKEVTSSAGRLSRAWAPLLQRDCSCAPGKPQCDSCQKKEKESALQRAAKGANGPVAAPPSVSRTLASPGTPLDSPTRAFMEPRFGQDFSGVRVHTDSAAAESARAVNAKAYTVGQHIVFDEGKYNPTSPSGKQLLAHELAHTVQQHGLQRSANQVRTDRGHEYNRLEEEASRAATAVLSGQPAALSSVSSPIISREDKAEEGKITTAKSKKKFTKQSNLGAHQVTPTESFQLGEKQIQEFLVEPFYVPGSKGPAAIAAYEDIAGDKLETVLSLQGSGKTKTALWQKREPTAELRDRWLSKVGWAGGPKNELWKNAGGGSEFPKLSNGKTCQMDHAVELQLGGDNTDQNIQPLEAGANQSSGGTIKAELESLAKDISSDGSLAPGEPEQIKLRFKSAKVSGPVEKLPGKCTGAKELTCLGIDKCAPQVAVEKTPTGEVEAARDEYPISAGGGAPRILKVPRSFTNGTEVSAEIESDPHNQAASTLIPGLLLKRIQHTGKKKATADIVVARIDDRPETRLPISLDKSSKDDIHLDVKAEGVLKLSAAAKAKTNLAFTYKYLSPGAITSLELNESGGVDWQGYIKPSVPLIGELGVQYKNGTLLVVKGLDPEQLKKRSILGMRVTRAEVQVQLSPFKPEGIIEIQAGSGDPPVAKASLSLSADSVGLVAQGKLRVNIPKMNNAESEISYKGGEGRDEWKAEIHIKSEDIKLGSSVSVTGGFDGVVDSKGLNFAGSIDATFAGGNTAHLGLKKQGEEWTLSGGGKFHFPKLDETTVTVEYNLGKDVLTATGKTGFTIESLKLSGRLDPVTFIIEKGGPPKVHGTGTLHIERGKVKGDATVHLHPNGKFSGKGTVSYKIKENIIVTGTVELNEQEKLRLTGELLVTRYEIFKQYGDKKDLFTVDFPIPVPGLSIGTSGVVFHIRGGVGVAYSFGPGVLEPLKFSAGFDPLESDPNLELEVAGSLKIPASATLSAFIEGSLAVQVDVYVGSAGAEGGLRLTGELRLDAGAFANFNAAYKQKHLTAKLVAGIDTKLLLGISLTAFVHAWAGAFGFKAETRKDWTLAKKVIDTGIGFYISAPFEYADDTGVKLPEFKDITLKKPDITKDNMKRILGEIFGSSSEKTTEK